MADLKIGVDARPLCHPGAGIYRYTRELLVRMCGMGGQWYFYSPQPYDKEEFAAANITHRQAHIPGFLGGSQASQVLFPYWARRDAIDVFWAPRHHIPVLLPAGIPSVLTVHDLVWQKHGASMRASRRFFEQLLMPRSLKRADKIVTGTQFIASELVTAFPDVASKLSVTPYASSFALNEAKRQVLSNELGYYLFVGTMEPRKNLPRLLGAYKAYVERCATVKKLKVVGGGGWGRVDPHELVAGLGLGHMVDIEGKVSDQELSALYAGAYALVMPSIYEGFGLPVVECLAYGVPAIISRDSALSEVAGAAGYTVDPLSETSICDALCVLTQQQALYDRLRLGAARRALDFSWEASAEVTHALLCDCG